MNQNTKKTTPKKDGFTDDKKGKKSVKDPDGSLTEKCEICGEYHPIHNDGFDYLDCMGWIKEQQRIKKMRKQNE